MEPEEQKLDEEQLHRMGTADLVRLALDESKLLIKAEVLHARRELEQELRQARTGAILLGIALVSGFAGIAVLFVALALALALPEPLATLVVGVGLLVIAGASAVAGARGLPKKPLPKTQDRLKHDLSITREELQ